jgi:murein DD-endopeptidase MepM/ murein hydrolase activator NlpD
MTQLALTLATAISLVVQQPFPLQISHRARALTPGEVILVEVRSRTPVEEMSAEWLGQPLIFYSVGGDRWQSLAPVDLQARAGSFTLRVKARIVGGGALTGDYAIVISERTFPTRRLSVEPKFATPPKSALARIERERRATEAIFARATPQRFWTDPFVVPVPGAATSSFGQRSIVNGQPRSPHAGTDFQAETGTPVIAPNRGRVALAEDLYFPGKTIILDHGAGVYSYLAHLSELGVKKGEMVERGQRIALSGASGRVTGPHLHWTMRLGKARVDPLSVVSVLRATLSQ